MRYPQILPVSKLEEVTLVSRRKRFLVDVITREGQSLTVHCANSGSMKSCFEPGWKAWISRSPNPNRKLSHTLELVDNGKGFICVNTGMANKLTELMFQQGFLPGTELYDEIRREVVYQPGTRFDFAAFRENRPVMYLEVKSVSFVRNIRYEFPDAVTERGQKHLIKLMDAFRSGYRAVLVFLLTRSDGSEFSPAEDIDPTYHSLLYKARDLGVEIYLGETSISVNEITGKALIPWIG